MNYSDNTARRGFTLIELLVVIVIIGILAAIALPNYIKVKDKAKEAEVKANLHNIQLSVERWAVDSEGPYPNYLIGGEPKYAAQVISSASAGAFNQVTEIDPTEQATDPLLRRGYIDAYPKNPFTTNGVAIHRVQENLPTTQSMNDPLRNGQSNPGADYGTRFGPYCTSMGSVLADPRYTNWVYYDLDSGTRNVQNTYANIEYDFWDMWEGNKPFPYLPGMFFFKSAGPIIAVGNEDAANAPIIPTQTDQYLLGGYGSLRTKGKDMLGEEQQIIYLMRADAGGTSNWLATAELAAGGQTGPMAGPPDNDGTIGGGPGDRSRELRIWPWTRSQSGDPSLRQGSPFAAAEPGSTNDQLQYGNPNGIRDGVILVLTAGEDYDGDR